MTCITPPAWEVGGGEVLKILEKKFLFWCRVKEFSEKKLKLHNPSTKNIFRITSLKLPSYKNKPMLADI